MQRARRALPLPRAATIGARRRAASSTARRAWKPAPSRRRGTSCCARDALRRGASPRMPAVFLGHGSPMNTLERNAHTDAWRALGERMPRPKAILAISAHWYVRGTAVTGDGAAADDPRLRRLSAGAARVPVSRARRSRAGGARARPAGATARPHGRRVGPRPRHLVGARAHVSARPTCPSCSSRIDAHAARAVPLRAGHASSRALRDDGVMVVGSGNIVHNLRDGPMGPDAAPFRGRRASTTRSRALIAARRPRAAGGVRDAGRAARMSVPTPEHYLPLLYVLGAQRDDDACRWSPMGSSWGRSACCPSHWKALQRRRRPPCAVGGRSSIVVFRSADRPGVFGRPVAQFPRLPADSGTRTPRRGDSATGLPKSVSPKIKGLTAIPMTAY